MSSRTLVNSTAVIIALLAAVPVDGQPPPAFPLAECKSFFKEVAKASLGQEEQTWKDAYVPEARKAATPPTTHGGAIVDSSFQIFAGKNEDQGEINYLLSRINGWGTTTDVAVTASAPFDKKAGESVFASLAGLSGDLELTSSVTRHQWQINADAYGSELCSECAEAGMTDLLDCSRAGLEKWWTDAGKPAADVTVQSAHLQDLLFGSTPSILFGFDASVARAERKFFNDDGTDDSEHRAGFSLSLKGGLVRRHGAFYGSIVAKRDYKENDAAQFCKPVPGSSLETCNELPRGRAERVNDLVSVLEWRHFFVRPGHALGKDWQLAIAPSLEIGFDDSEWVFQLPFYFLPSKKQELTGGIKVGWGSEDDELVAGVFVTKGLGLGPE